MVLKCFSSRLIGILFAMSCLPLTAQSTCSEAKPAARVGRFEITKKDVTYRNAITKIYHPREELDRGRDFLIQAFVYAQILENNGYRIDEEVLRKEARRMERSMTPEMVQKIHSIFDSDQESYLKVFVLPTYVERALYYEYFLRDPRVQESSRRKAREYLVRVARHPEFFRGNPPAEARSKNRFIVSTEYGLTWELDEVKPAESLSAAIPPKLNREEPWRGNARQEQWEEGKKWKQEIVDAVTPGAVFPKVVDMGEMWLVARYLGPRQTGTIQHHHFEGVLFPKANFEEWLRREKEKVNVEIYGM